MSDHAWELTDEQLPKSEPLTATLRPSKKSGCKGVDYRRCVESILWVCLSEARRMDRPE
jgi:hypothetical protein